MATTKSLPQDSAASGKKKRKKRKLPLGVVVKDGRWYVRVRYREEGQRHAAWRECAKNATDARDVRKALLQELHTHGTRSLRQSQRTWASLATYYETEYLIPARYVDGKKVAGRRNLRNPKSQLKRLNELIPATTRLREIDYEFARRVRLDLAAQPKRNGGQRSMVDIDRHMSLFRHMMKVARAGLRWIHHDPFADAMEPLITPADEKKRRRLMSFQEEDLLLAQCVDTWVEFTRKDGRRGKMKRRRAHMRIVIIGLVDSLMRSGEFFKLRRKDLAFDPRTVTVQQMNTKTLCERSAPITQRFGTELKRWFETHEIGLEDRIFPFSDVKRAWNGIKADAGITDLRLKDLRRTGATRLLRQGYPIEEISRLLGHTTREMTYEYIGIDQDTTSRAADILDAMHARREQLDLIH